MKKLIFTFFILITGLSYSIAQQMRVATYNIRQKNDHDIGNMWDERKDAVANLIKYHQFEIFGIQEAFIEQVKDLQDRLPDFKSVGVGRDDGAEKGEHSSIFYNKNRFEAKKSGTFGCQLLTPSNLTKGGMPRYHGSVLGRS
ncbi:hypothetical protein OKW96_07100 [Sphingobacterium sp. KU25419]|nr:hypothetical protein OKW96_07100 [Sphingobacterium sp. KU25419]